MDKQKKRTQNKFQLNEGAQNRFKAFSYVKVMNPTVYAEIKVDLCDELLTGQKN